MKTIKRKLVVVVFMLGTVFNYANNTKEVSRLIETTNVKVEFKDVKKGHTLTIKDKQGNILHSENATKKGNLTKVFDLSSLKDGMYSIELHKDFRILVKPFKVASHQVIFEKNLEKVIFKPIIRAKEDLIFISKKALDKEAVKIIIYYNDNPIHTEVITNALQVNRIYKLDPKEKGTYRAVVYSNKKSYTKNFTL
jgi:hypothetical protein